MASLVNDLEAREPTTARPSKDRWRVLSGYAFPNALDEPPVPSLPDELESSHDDSIVDLAHWLKTTDPPEPPRTPKSPKGPRKLVKRSLRGQSVSQRTPNSLSGFKPRGVEEKLSKDGKRYFQIKPQQPEDQSHSEPTSVHASANVTARPSTDLMNRSDRRLSRFDQFQASRPTSGNFDRALSVSEQQQRSAVIRNKRRSSSVEALQTLDKTQDRLSMSLGKARPVAPALQSSGPQKGFSESIARSNSNPSGNMSRPIAPFVEPDRREMVRYDTPEHFRGEREVEPHAALSSNPVSDGSAPLKPLPSVPHAVGTTSHNEMVLDSQNKGPGVSNEIYYDASQGQPNAGERASNQGVRRTSHEKFTKALFAPVDRGNDLRSLHAMSSYLRRGDSTGSHSQSEIPESSGVEVVHPSGRDEKPAPNGVAGVPNYSRPAALRDNQHRSASFQHGRNEQVRARKLRDLQRGRHSSDESNSRPSTRGSAPTSRPGSRNMLQESTTERRSHLDPSPEFKVEGGGATSGGGFDGPSHRGSSSSSLKSREKPRALLCDENEQATSATRIRTSQPSQNRAVEGGLPTRKHTGDSRIGEARVAPDIDTQGANRGHDRNRQMSETLPTIASASTENFMTPLNETRPPSLSAMQNVISPSNTARDPLNTTTDAPAYHATPSNEAPIPRPPPPKSPAMSIQSNRSTTKDTRASQTPSQLFDPQARLQARVELLERENKLLEAALMAVLKTNGKLNGCPCGGSSSTSKSPTDALRPPHSHVAKPARPSKHEAAAHDRLDVSALRQSVVSNATSNWSDDSFVASTGKRPLDLYMATRAGHGMSYDPSLETS